MILHLLQIKHHETKFRSFWVGAGEQEYEEEETYDDPFDKHRFFPYVGNHLRSLSLDLRWAWLSLSGKEAPWIKPDASHQGDFPN